MGRRVEGVWRSWGGVFAALALGRINACDASGVMTAAAWKLMDCFTTAPSTLPVSFCTSPATCLQKITT